MPQVSSILARPEANSPQGNFRPSLPRAGWSQPVLFGRRPVAVVLRPVGDALQPAATRMRRGTGSYVRDLRVLEVG